MSGTTIYDVATEAQLNAAISAIDNGGTASATNTAYLIVLTSDLTLTSNIAAINLAAGDTLTVEGLNSGNNNNTAQIDGNGTYRGFVVTAGTVDLSNLSMTGMSAPGGTGGNPGGGAALAVGANATVATSAVTFNGGGVRGGTPAGGAIFVTAGGTLSVSGGSVSGSGNIPGNGIFIQGNDSITLVNTTVSGAISDQTGSKSGAGAGSLVVQGTVTLSGTSQFTGGTTIEGALSLLAPAAAGSGAIAFASTTGESLIVGAGDTPTNQIDGFVANLTTGLANTDSIDLAGIGAPAGYSLSATNQLTVVGSQATVTLNLDPSLNYGADAFILTPDAGTGTSIIVVQNGYQVSSEADLNAALQAIDVGGKWSAPNVAYTITLTAGFVLSTDLLAINLATGDSLTINGAGNVIDGGGAHRGFFDYVGGLTLENLTIQNAIASGGAGGTGAVPGGGGAGLGGGLFVGAQGAATLQNVSFLNDQAIGGAAGATGTGVGGGGGLGGTGGAGGARAAGGGGVGLSATGGSSTGVIAGGAGIIPGAASGNGGTGNRPVGGAGGSGGGGGGAAGITVTSGSGRGGGGSRSYPGVGGSGGVAGTFGGGAGGGEIAGFGGGGANSAGGWGGGGSGGAAGGFGGGGGGGAGGGLGAGGAVFVQQGGSLTIAGGSLSGGGASGGAGTNGGGTGAAYGAGIFLQGSGVVSFAPASGQTLSIADPIAGDGGSSSVVMSGPGTVVLSGANSFTGGTTLLGGTLSLQAPGAAGSGQITFAYGEAAAMVVGAGDIPTNVISGFLPNDTIDLQGIGTATGATVNGDILNVTGGTIPVQLALDPNQNFTGETFVTTSDNAGGTLLTAVNAANDFPPSISGTGTFVGNDHTPLNPLAGVIVSDLDPGQTETVTVTLSSTANGSLSNLAGGAYDATAGVYTVSGTTATVTSALNGLIFTPTVNEVAPGQIVTTSFALSATDGIMTSTATKNVVAITALNDAPVISGVGWDYGYWNVPLTPFAGATVTDPDVGATESVSFTVSSYWLGFGDQNGLLSLSLPGFTLTHTGNGTYTLSGGTTPAQITAAIDAVQFTPVPYPNDSGATDDQIGVTVSDGIAPPVSASANVQAGLPIFAGIAANQTVVDGTTIAPFSAVTITDSAGLTIQGMTIELYDSSANFQVTTDANGTLSGANLTKTGVGMYTLAPGTTQSVSAELDALVFTPANSNVAATTDFYLLAFDGATTSGNIDTSVTALAGAPVPVISGTVPGQSVADNAVIAPLSTVMISDGNPSPSDSATISLLADGSSTPTDANGILSGAGLIETSPGIYALAATDPVTLSGELDALVFTPTLNEAPPGFGVVTTFAIAVTDPNGTVTDQTTSITAIPSAVQPVIAATAYGQLVADDGSTIAPFSAVTITDDNPSPTDSVVITVNDISAGLLIATPSDADGTLSGTGLTYIGVGQYALAAADPATIAAELNGLVFTPTANLVSAGQTATTAFTLSVADNLAVATDYNTSVIITPGAPPTIALDPVAGGNAVNAADALAGFSMTGTTTGVEDGQTVWVLISGFAFSATVASGTWSAAIDSAHALALGDGSFTAYAYVTNLAGITSQTVSEAFSVNLAGAVAATPTITPTTVAFGAMRVGAAPVTKSITVSNGSTSDPDQSSLSYALGALPAAVSGGANANGTLASGASTPVQLTLATNVAGALSAATVSVSLTSLAPGGSGLANATLPSGALTLSGKVYAPAVPVLSISTINFGVVHVGDTVSQTVGVSNAAAGALTDVLTGGFGSISSGFSGSGTLGAGVAAGATSPLTLTLKTTSSGTFSGSASLNLASHDADLANIAVTAGPVALSGTVDNYAVAALKKVSGTGTLSQTGTNYVLNFGTLNTGASAPTVTIDAFNAATGLADLLSGVFSVTGATGFTNTGLTAFGGLGAGQTDGAPTISLSTVTPGTFSETITLTPTGSNTSGYTAALPTETLTITGIVTTPVYTLTTGTDTVKAGSGTSVIVAASNTLSSGDSITGSTGATTLNLVGGGVFNLAAPSTLSNVQTIAAQEGQNATAQTVTLRANLNATVNVASDTSGDLAPGITIIGATNTDTINLGTGNDTVTLGAGETVNDSGGNNTYIVTAATIKSTIHGGTGFNTLVVNGGGTVTMGGAIRGISAVTLSGTTNFTANALPYAISGSVAGGDVITLGAPGQSVTATGPNERVKATAQNAGDQLVLSGANSTLEITSGGTVSLNAATSVGSVTLDSAAVLQLNGIGFITAIGSSGNDSITAGGINQTLTGGSGTDTLTGFAGGFDTFRDTASGLNGDTIRTLVASDKIDVTNLGFAGAKLTVTASGSNTVVKAVSGSTTSTFTLGGSFSASGFQLASDGTNGTLITHT